MKKIVFYTTLFAIVLLHTLTIYAQQFQIPPQGIQLQSPETITITCPATYNLNVQIPLVPPSGWKSASVFTFSKLTPLGGAEVKNENTLNCLYHLGGALCNQIKLNGGQIKCWVTISQERSGYFCEENPSNNGFVCKKKQSVEQKPQRQKPPHR